MRDENITRIVVDWDNPPKGKTDWARVDAMTDEEAYQNALDDPDNPPSDQYPEGALKPVFRTKMIRWRLGMSQQEFADTFGFSLRSLQMWEQGKPEPNKAICTYIRVIATDPEAVMRALDKTVA